MAEYIERDKVVFPYMHTKVWGMNNDTRKAYNEGVKAAEDAIKAIPAADVVERKRGEWEQDCDGDWYCTHCDQYSCICESGEDRTYRNPFCPTAVLI